MNIVEALSVLGLEVDADDEQIRARYRELVKQSPPERDPGAYGSPRHRLG